MKKSWKIPAVAGIILVVLNIIFFAMPIHKTAVFWISDLVVAVAIIAQVPIADMAFKENSSLTSKVYGWPVMSVGLRFLAILSVFALVFILLSGSNRHFPLWIPIVVYAIVYGLVWVVEAPRSCAASTRL